MIQSLLKSIHIWKSQQTTRGPDFLEHGVQYDVSNCYGTKKFIKAFTNNNCYGTKKFIKAFTNNNCSVICEEVADKDCGS